MKTVREVYLAVCAEVDRLLAIPTVEAVTVDLGRHNTEEYELAVKQNNLTKDFRFLQSEARFLKGKIRDGCVLDTLLYLERVGKLNNDTLCELVRKLEGYGADLGFAFGDEDCVRQLKVKGVGGEQG